VLYNESVDLYYLDSIAIFLLSESSNLFFCSIILFILFYFKKLDQRELIIWFSGFLSIILLAPIIQELFPDSGGYLRCVRDLKDNFRFDEFGCQASIAASSESFQFFNFKRSAPAIYYSIIPIPSIATIMSLGFINKLYLLALYLFIRKRITSSDARLYLLLILFFPTMLVYSATGLRETFVFVVQSLLLLTIIERKFFISTGLMLLLFSIKTQNAAVLSILYTAIFIFSADKSFKRLLIFSIAFLFIIFYNEHVILNIINYFRLGFLNEIGLIPPGGILSEFESIIQIILNSPILFLKGLFAPGIGFSGLNLVFFPESLVFIFITLVAIKYSNYFSEPSDYLVFLTFYTGIVLNFMVVENDSTFLRYRFTFIYLFLFHLILTYDKRAVHEVNDSLKEKKTIEKLS
tara:strand:+ start:3054 stop:4271 length:1218 start_codon:yes stop_codon:yes gene_type:complete